MLLHSPGRAAAGGEDAGDGPSSDYAIELPARARKTLALPERQLPIPKAVEYVRAIPDSGSVIHVELVSQVEIVGPPASISSLYQIVPAQFALDGEVQGVGSLDLQFRVVDEGNRLARDARNNGKAGRLQHRYGRGRAIYTDPKCVALVAGSGAGAVSAGTAAGRGL